MKLEFRKLSAAFALSLCLTAAPLVLADNHEGKEETCDCQKKKKCECKGESGCACAHGKNKKAKKEKKAEKKTEDHSAH